jgi:hypothetical protein
MKVQDTLEIDLVWATLNDKLMNFVGASRCLGSWDRWQSIQFVKETFPSWQYNGVAPFPEVAVWCEQHFGNNWIWNFETVYFKHERDRTMFMLKWA